MVLTTRPHRLLFVTTDLFIGGGAEGMLVRMVTARERLADEIDIISLVPGDSHTQSLRAAGVSVIELDARTPLGACRGLLRIARHIRESRPDVVQGWMYHGDLAALLGLVISGRRHSTRLVWGIRCSDMDLGGYGIGLRVVVKACALLSRFPDIVTANSLAGLRTHLGLGYRPRRAEVTANGIDVEELRPDAAARAAVRQELGIPADAVVLAHLARVDLMKDHDSFLAAMSQTPQLRAMMIGAGTERLPQLSNVLRLGRRRDVARVLAAADFIVSSSRFGEGFSNALAEGMACGLPAIATDVGDARLIIGETGIVVPPGRPDALVAAIRQLTDEPASERAKRGLEARARIVENFSMARALQRHAEVYASLTGEAGDLPGEGRVGTR